VHAIKRQKPGSSRLQKTNCLRVSISVAPANMETFTAVNLSEWPSQIAARAASIKLAVADVVDGAIANPRYIKAKFSTDLPGDFASGATRLWRKIFEEVDPDGFHHLMAVIKAEEAGEKAADAGAARFHGYQAAELGSFLDALYAFAGQRALEARLSGRRDKKSGDGRAHSRGNLTRDEWSMLDRLVPWGGVDAVSQLASSAGAAGADVQNLADQAALWRTTAEGATTSAEALQDKIGSTVVALQKAERQVLSALRAGSAGPAADLAAADARRNAVETALQPLAQEIRRFAASWGLLPGQEAQPVQPRDQGAADPDLWKKDAAGRKLAGILAYPTLAKYLGMIVDVYVDLDDWDGPAAGALAAVFAEDAPAAASSLGPWTAYSLSAGSPAYFGPASSSKVYVDGLVDLNDKHVVGVDAKGKPLHVRRFDLVSVDVTNGTARVLGQLSAGGEARRSGRLVEETDSPLPELPERGIALIDRYKPKQSLTDMADVNAAKRSANATLNFAEDLIRGIALDVATSRADGALNTAEAGRWRTLMGRDIGFGIDPDFLAHDAVRRVRARDEGHVGHAVWTKESGGSLDVVTPVEVAAWMGESLAAPVNTGAPECREVWIDPACDLAVDVSVNLPGPPSGSELDRRPPPLRFGRGYYFGARLKFVNGCGLSFDDAVKRYTTNAAPLLLGAPGGEPYVFKRRRRAQSPDVLLPPDEPLVSARKQPPGETVDTLVVRSRGASTPRARRFVVPPRIAFDQAEQEGMFDDAESASSKRPRGAFRKLARAVLDPVLGTLPVARDGSWELPARPGTGDNQPRQASRGAVFALSRNAPDTEQEYYPDPLTPSFCADLFDENNTPLGASDERRFWRVESGGEAPGPKPGLAREWHPRDALPVVLELRRIPKPPASPADRFGYARDRVVVKRVDEGELLLPRLTIAIAPAEVLHLDLRPAPPIELMLRRLHGLAKAWANLGPLRTALDAPADAAFLHRLMCQETIAPWTEARRLRLVHAVEKPIAAPSFGRIHPVVLTVGPDGPDNEPPRPNTWARYVEEHENCGSERCDPSTWESREGGATCFFVGEIGIHRASTGRVRCDASWLEHGPEGLRNDGGRWRYDPAPNYARLFQIDSIPSGGGSEVDLLRDAQALRKLSYSFPDGRARALSLQLIGTSRFTQFYDGGDHDLASPPFAKSPARIILPCTFRPPVPEVDRILPLFNWSRTVDRQRRVYGFSRHSALRVHLKPNIYASGIDEMLGLLFWPGKSGSSDLCGFESETGKSGQSLTQWGNDPIETSPGLPDVPDTQAFTGWTAAPKFELMMPPPSAEGADPNAPVDAKPLPVRVLGYSPRIDPAHGAYCDIGIEPVESYAPFVRLGLARYQPHAVKGLELSKPIVKWAQVLPWRSGTVTISGRDVAIEIKGPGYCGRRVAPGGPEQASASLMSIRLMRAANGAMTGEKGEPGWLPVFDEEGNPVEHLFLPGRACPNEGDKVEGLALWSTTLRLPRSRSQVHYGISVEEVEWISGAPAREDAGSCGKTELEAVPRAPIFLHTIDIGLDVRRPPRADPQAERFKVDHQPAVLPLQVDDLRLVEPARSAAIALAAEFPDIVFTSGRHEVASLARAMASNVMINRFWIQQTYKKSKEREALQGWVDAHWQESSQSELEAGIAAIVGGWDEQQKSRFSRHFSGLAFDMRPLRAKGVMKKIRQLKNLKKFIAREGELGIWHLEFEAPKD
jgi:hypothetical protein